MIFSPVSMILNWLAGKLDFWIGGRDAFITTIENEEPAMTDIKKTKKNKGGAKVKKLQLHKETLKDLSAKNSGQVKGGTPRPTEYVQCTS